MCSSATSSHASPTGHAGTEGEELVQKKLAGRGDGGEGWGYQSIKTSHFKRLSMPVRQVGYY